MARPRKEIDRKSFESLCGIQCTQEEICQFFSVTDKTLNSWCKRQYGKGFSEVFAEKRGMGRISLRRAGFDMAKRNPSVHIFYAKNFLGMEDKPERRDDVAIETLDAILKEMKKNAVQR